MILLGQDLHVMKGLDPIADAFAGATVYSDVFDLQEFQQLMFVVYRGVATGGTATGTLTVQACDNTTPSNRTPVPFRYRVCTSGDTWGALTDATASGFAMTAGSSQLYLVVVDPRMVMETSGFRYCQLKQVEGVDDPVVGCIIAIGGGLRYSQAIANSQID